MKVRHLATLGIVFLVLISGCRPSTSTGDQESTDDYSETTTSLTTSITSSTSSSDSSTSEVPDSSSDDSPTTSPPTSSEVIAPENEEVAFLTNSYLFGNTNGNTYNRGLAVYDFDQKVHYYAHQGAIYRYHPVTKESTTLLSGLGKVMFLTLYDNQLYYLGSESQYLYAVDLTTLEVTTALSQTVNYLARQTTYLYAKTTIPSYGDDEWLIYYNPKTMNRVKERRGMENINQQYNKLLFTTTTEPTIIKVAANNLIGTSTIKNFATLNFTSIEQLLLLHEAFDDENDRLFFVKLRSDEGDFLYLYEQKTDRLTFIDFDYGYHSYNSDDQHLYYVSSSGIHVYNYLTKTVDSTINFSAPVRNLNIVNRYLYYESGSEMYRYHLISRQSELVG